MKKYLNVIFLFAIAFLFASCVGQKELRKVKTMSFTPDRNELHLSAHDFDEIGQTTISFSYSTYFGAFTTIHAINDKKYDRRNVEIVKLDGFSDLKTSGIANLATIKVIEEFPDADFYVPVYTKKKVKKMFLGQEVHEEILITAYKLKLGKTE